MTRLKIQLGNSGNTIPLLYFGFGLLFGLWVCCVGFLFFKAFCSHYLFSQKKRFLFCTLCFADIQGGGPLCIFLGYLSFLEGSRIFLINLQCVNGRKPDCSSPVFIFSLFLPEGIICLVSAGQDGTLGVPVLLLVLQVPDVLLSDILLGPAERVSEPSPKSHFSPGMTQH